MSRTSGRPGGPQRVKSQGGDCLTVGSRIGLDDKGHRAVAFAGLCGLEEIAEREGAEASLAVLQSALDRLIRHCLACGGEVGNVMGGELLCVFPSSDAALDAAYRMQRDIDADPGSPRPGLSLAVGIHHGPVHRTGAEVFGNSVNTAARVRAEARPGQILLTREARDALRLRSHGALTTFDRVRLKGKSEELTLVEASWKPSDLNSTSVMEKVVDAGYLSDLAADRLELTLGDARFEVTAQTTPVHLGRGSQCEIRVASTAASRLHARIDHRRGKFLLTDLSTNGTHLIRSDGSETTLKREEALLTGSGRFALGEPATVTSRWAISFTSRGNADQHGADSALP